MKIRTHDFKDLTSINNASQITKNSSVRTNVDTYAGVYETVQRRKLNTTRNNHNELLQLNECVLLHLCFVFCMTW